MNFRWPSNEYSLTRLNEVRGGSQGLLGRICTRDYYLHTKKNQCYDN